MKSVRKISPAQILGPEPNFHKAPVLAANVFGQFWCAIASSKFWGRRPGGGGRGMVSAMRMQTKSLMAAAATAWRGHVRPIEHRRQKAAQSPWRARWCALLPRCFHKPQDADQQRQQARKHRGLVDHTP
jgi:hypothetical protein